jgi:hypothetical protein
MLSFRYFSKEVGKGLNFPTPQLVCPKLLRLTVIIIVIPEYAVMDLLLQNPFIYFEVYLTPKCLLVHIAPPPSL